MVNTMNQAGKLFNANTQAVTGAQVKAAKIIADTQAAAAKLKANTITAASLPVASVINPSAVKTVIDNKQMLQDYTKATGDTTDYNTPVSLATGAAIAYGNNVTAIASDPETLSAPENAAIVAPATTNPLIRFYHWFLSLFSANSFDGYDNGADYYKAVLIHNDQLRKSKFFGEKNYFDPGILADILHVGGAGIAAANQDLVASGKAPILTWLPDLTGATNTTDPNAPNYTAPGMDNSKLITLILVSIAIIIVTVIIFKKLKKK